MDPKILVETRRILDNLKQANKKILEKPSCQSSTLPQPVVRQSELQLPNSHTFLPPIRPLFDNRANIAQKLTRYINRIEREKTTVRGRSVINYAFGFVFFRQSQATNRHANHLLAKDLKERLEAGTESISSIFNHIDSRRQNLARHIKNFRNHNRGINSEELLGIIKVGKRFATLEREQQPFSTI